MSVATLSATATIDAHRAFDAALGRIDAAINYSFRRWPRGQYEDACAEARAYTWAAWHGLLRRGKDPVAVGVSGIVAYSCRAVKKGRSVGSTRSAGRGAMDLQHPKVRLAAGPRVVSLGDLAGETSGAWQDWLASCRRYGPADEACFRVDFLDWLDRLPARKRQVAELLAEGHDGVVVAEALGLTQGRVSQIRSGLRADWAAYQAEAVPATTTDPPTSPPRTWSGRS